LKKEKINIGSNKNFGIVFSLIFFIISLFPLLDEGNVRIWSLIVSVIFLILGLLNSSLLTTLNRIWFKFGILLGNFVSPLAMGLIFFAVVTPTSLLMKLFGKDILNLKKK